MPTYTLSREYAFATLGQEATEATIADLKRMGYVEGTDYVVSSDNYIYYVTKRPNSYNPDLTWEKTTTYNAGIDYAFLNNRINGSLDFYYRFHYGYNRNVNVKPKKQTIHLTEQRTFLHVLSIAYHFADKD